MEVARQERRLCTDSAWCALKQCTHLCIDECTFEGIAVITYMHAAPFLRCVDMRVLVFCVCIRVHLCLDMRSVQAGDRALCTIWSNWSSGSTARAASAFSVMICVRAIFCCFTACTVLCAHSVL